MRFLVHDTITHKPISPYKIQECVCCQHVTRDFLVALKVCVVSIAGSNDRHQNDAQDYGTDCGCEVVDDRSGMRFLLVSCKLISCHVTNPDFVFSGIFI